MCPISACHLLVLVRPFLDQTGMFLWQIRADEGRGTVSPERQRREWELWVGQISGITLCTSLKAPHVFLKKEEMCFLVLRLCAGVKVMC